MAGLYGRRIQETTKQLDMQKGGINGVLAKMGGLGSAAKAIIPVFGKIGAVAATVQQLGVVFETINMAVGKFVARQKAVQGFQLAMEGFGLSVSESNGLLDAAAGISLKYGANLQSVEKGLKRITPTLVSMGGTAGDAEAIMSAMSARVATLGLNSEQSGRYMEAFAQVMGKGKLQGEELNQQFAELDGSLRPAVAQFLKAEYGIDNLDDAMRNGEVSAEMFAEAIVDSSRQMQENLAGAIDSVQDKIGKFNIQQMQAVMDTLNTKAIEEVGRQFEAVGKVAMSVQVTFTQFFASIVTQGQTSGEFVSATLALIGGALAFIGDVAMLAVKGILSIIEVIMRLGKAIGEFIYNIPGLKQAFNAIGAAAEWTAGMWGKVKDIAFQNNIETKEANKTLSLSGKTLREYSVNLQDVAKSTGSMSGATAIVNPLVTEYANQVLGAGSVTAKMTEEVSKLVKQMVEQATALEALVNASLSMESGLRSQVQDVERLASSFDRAGMSEAAFLAQAKGVQSTLSSQTSALQDNLNKLRQRVAAGETLNDMDAKSLQQLPDLIDRYRTLTERTKEAVAEGKAYADSKSDATIRVKEFTTALASNIAQLQEAVGSTGAFSAEERELSSAAQDAATKVMEQVRSLEAANAAIIATAGGTAQLTTSQQEQIAKNEALAAKLLGTSQKYSDLADETNRVTTQSGDLNPALKKAISSLQGLAQQSNLSADAQVDLAAKSAALKKLIGDDLKDAMSSYNTLIEKQIKNNGQLSDEEASRLSRIKDVISNLNDANNAVESAINANKNLADEVRSVGDAFNEMREDIKDQTVDMQASIVAAENLSTQLSGLNNGISPAATALSRMGMSAGQATSAINSQISSLEGYQQKLINAKLAGIALSEAQEAMIATAGELVDKLKETKEAISGVGDSSEDSAKKVRSFSLTLFDRDGMNSKFEQLLKNARSTAAEVDNLRRSLSSAQSTGSQDNIRKIAVDLEYAEEAADKSV